MFEMFGIIEDNFSAEGIEDIHFIVWIGFGILAIVWWQLNSTTDPVALSLGNHGGGLLVIIILAVGIYTFILAPEDMTADLYKVKESIDPLSKSLTGVSYDSDLPGEEDEDDDIDTEELLDDDEEEFDESKLLAELTGTGSQKLESDDDEEKEEPEPPKKAVKKKVIRKSVSKKVVRKAAAPPQDAPKRPPVNMGEGIISITCPSCAIIHNVDEDTIKFICSCGRRIRVI